MRWWSLRKELSDRPEVEKLERFLKRALEERGEDVEFVVLFGSMARGDWSLGSDYDVLIGLRKDDGKRLVERMAEFDRFAEGNIQVFPYSRSEWRRMFSDFNPLLLEALEDGVVLWDRGAFSEMRKVFEGWRKSGKVRRRKMGWEIREGG